MVGDGDGSNTGRLVGITGSRDTGADGIVIDCTDSCGERWCGRGRGGGGGGDTTASRSGCRAAWSGSTETA
ncbi:hypothetical protein AB0346_16680 [Nocardia beijingensis]|uniref:hypothetical protein n=1 Tax=Nocardia beijingensis TaxID=95162 RepID=UPI00344BA04A